MPMHFLLLAVFFPCHFPRTESLKPCTEQQSQQTTAISFWKNLPLTLVGRLAPVWDPVAGTQKNWTGWRMSLSVTEKMQMASDWGESSPHTTITHSSFYSNPCYYFIEQNMANTAKWRHLIQHLRFFSHIFLIPLLVLSEASTLNTLICFCQSKVTFLSQWHVKLCQRYLFWGMLFWP